MNLIVGLGNPGEKFTNTRHNIGFMIVDDFVKELTSLTKDNLWQKVERPKLTFIKTKDLLILKPLTYMNLSGLSLSYIANFYKIKIKDIWVVYDDIDLPLGKLRIRRGGGSAGHHGIESIIKELGNDDFVRFRVGVGRRRLGKEPERNIHRREVERYVLSPFTTHQAGDLRKIIKKTTKAIETCLKEGIMKGMNQFN